VLEIVRRVERQDRDTRLLAQEELRRLRALRVGHRGVDAVAGRERVGQRLLQVGLARLRLLDAVPRLARSPGSPADHVIRVGDMADELPERANVGRGLERVLVFRHLLRGLGDESLHDVEGGLRCGRQRVRGGLRSCGSRQRQDD
jgi:hypothetical protein